MKCSKASLGFFGGLLAGGGAVAGLSIWGGKWVYDTAQSVVSTLLTSTVHARDINATVDFGSVDAMCAQRLAEPFVPVSIHIKEVSFAVNNTISANMQEILEKAPATLAYLTGGILAEQGLLLLAGIMATAVAIHVYRSSYALKETVAKDHAALESIVVARGEEEEKEADNSYQPPKLR